MQRGLAEITKPTPALNERKTSLAHVAYFSMEMAIDQSLHTYSGGLGFLSGSHMLSAGSLGLPMVGVTVLWSQGYGEQYIDDNNQVQIRYEHREYDFLVDTGIIVEVEIFGQPVKIKALKLEKETFGTCPVYFLTTDIDENPEETRKLTHKLYDGEERIRISQEIILGIGGMRVLKAAEDIVDIVHMNEGHALPAVFEMLNDNGYNYDLIRQKTVFTTHTPVAAGNETHNIHLLMEAGFFAGMSFEDALRLGGEEFSLTVAALRMARLANGVSQLHGLVANNMWQWVEGRCPITAITNATNLKYWQDTRVKNAIKDNADDERLLSIKRDMKQELFDYIQKTRGKTFDPDVLTIVWGRRFTEYKRPTLIFSNPDRVKKLLKEKKIQLIFCGKFHPKDTRGRELFNELLGYSKELEGMAVLSEPGYELELSGLLKRGSDLWLNTPVRPLEASGTSGMSANMNGTLHFSIMDGWAVEGTYHNLNGFLINHQGHQMEYLNPEDRHRSDYESMMRQLEDTIIPMFYNDKTKWVELMRQAIHTSSSYFDSNRMALEYYTRLYQPSHL